MIRKYRNLKRIKNLGFTLSEILITLGVIGVVAAITMPVLIKKYNKMAWANKAKQSYNLLQNMVIKMMSDDGVTKLGDTAFYTNMPTDNRWPYIEENLKKYLHIVNIYQCNNGDSRCKYKYYNRNNETFYQTGRWYYLSNGMKFMLGEQNLYRILVDINGDKGPNIAGRDYFYWHTSNGKIIPRGSCITETGIPSNDCWKTTTKWDIKCDPNSMSLGTSCTARLMENGWVMDY